MSPQLQKVSYAGNEDLWHLTHEDRPSALPVSPLILITALYSVALKAVTLHCCRDITPSIPEMMGAVGNDTPSPGNGELAAILANDHRPWYKRSDLLKLNFCLVSLVLFCKLHTPQQPLARGFSCISNTSQPLLQLPQTVTMGLSRTASRRSASGTLLCWLPPALASV
jgi:hypothetical protein